MIGFANTPLNIGFQTAGVSPVTSAVNAIIGVEAFRPDLEWMICAAVGPSISGMRMSIRIISKGSDRAALTASAPPPVLAG
jgi:hypothetical protein